MCVHLTWVNILISKEMQEGNEYIEDMRKASEEVAASTNDSQQSRLEEVIMPRS